MPEGLLARLALIDAQLQLRTHTKYEILSAWIEDMEDTHFCFSR